MLNWAWLYSVLFSVFWGFIFQSNSVLWKKRPYDDEHLIITLILINQQ